MGAAVPERVGDRRLKVVEKGVLRPRLVGVAARFAEDARVPRLADVGAGREDEPEGIVVEAAAYVRVALLRQGLVLVVARAVGKLRRGDVEDALARAGRQHVHEAEDVLVGVAVAHAAADARLVARGRAGEVEGRHALVLVPGVDHALQVLVRSLGGLVGREEVLPAPLQRAEGCVDDRNVGVFREDLPAFRLVHHERRVEFREVALLDVGEHEREGLLLPGLSVEVDLVRADRVPAVGVAVRALAGEDRLGIVQPVVDAHEGVPRGVVPVDRARAAEERVVVPALAVLGLVVDRRALDLDLADRVGALVVRHVVQRLEEAELDEGEEGEPLGGLRRVADGDLPDLQVLVGRDEDQLLDLDARPCAP